MTGRNVIVLMSDEHTRSVYGAYGNPQVHTPNLDRLAGRGVRFENAYTTSPICIPARASFATGSHVFEHRCWSSAEPYYGQQQSWMHRLRDRGHEVVSIGKQHYRSASDDTGFTNQILPMYLFNDGKGWPQALLRRPLTTFPGAAELAQLGPGETSYTRYDRDITVAAVDWLEGRTAANAKPWVLFVSFVCPHFPLSAPQSFFDLYRDLQLPEPYDCDSARQLKHPVLDEMRKFWNYADYFTTETEVLALKNYYALCSFLDDNLGQVLTALENSAQGNNTDIIYTSDHGDMIGNHGIWCKSYMYEDSVGIPLIFCSPDVDPAINNTPVSMVDIATTIEQAVGCRVEHEADNWRGRPLQHVIEAPDYERPVLSEYHDGGSPCGFYMLRKGRWKYLYFSEGHPELLFDMEDDPHELTDLAHDPSQASILTSLRDELLLILEPEEVNHQAFADQARRIEEFGGIDAINAMASFNHTPLE